MRTATAIGIRNSIRYRLTRWEKIILLLPPLRPTLNKLLLGHLSRFYEQGVISDRQFRMMKQELDAK